MRLRGTLSGAELSGRYHEIPDNINVFKLAS